MFIRYIYKYIHVYNISDEHIIPVIHIYDKYMYEDMTLAPRMESHIENTDYIGAYI